MLRSDRAIDAVLLTAIVVDVVLVGRTALDPGWWFEGFHGHRDPTAAELAFLYRCAAHWTAFALFQIAGLALWRRWTPALLIVAGLRFSDVFTDWVYLATSESLTAVAGPLLFAPGLLNWGMALFLTWAWTTRGAGGPGERE